MNDDLTIEQSIRGLVTVLAMHLATHEQMAAVYPGWWSAVRHLVGFTGAAIEDARRWLGDAEVDEIMRQVRVGAASARDEAPARARRTR